MSERADIEVIRAEALRKLGRNVVNFQKVEACLKYLVTVCNVQGTPAAVSDRLQTKAARIRRESLGNLANAFHEVIFTDELQPSAPPDITEIWVSISMKVTADSGEIAKRKRALAALVAERNRLIHQDLVTFNHDSAENCRALIDLLDAQNPRILEELAALKLMIHTLKENLAATQAWIDSDDFLEAFKVDALDA